MVPFETIPSTGASGGPSALADGTPAQLSCDESACLDALSARDEYLTVAALGIRTGLQRDHVRAALEGLRAKGLVVRLNTVIGSYAARLSGHPGETD